MVHSVLRANEPKNGQTPPKPLASFKRPGPSPVFPCTFPVVPYGLASCCYLPRRHRPHATNYSLPAPPLPATSHRLPTTGHTLQTTRCLPRRYPLPATRCPVIQKRHYKAGSGAPAPACSTASPQPHKRRARPRRTPQCRNKSQPFHHHRNPRQSNPGPPVRRPCT